MKYHFITFATTNYLQNAKELCESALNVGRFDTAKIYNLHDIDALFLNKNKHIFSHQRVISIQ